MILSSKHAMGAIMAKRLRFVSRGSQALWRRRADLCVLMGESPRLAAIKDIVGNRAVLEAQPAPTIGSVVELHHPEGGVLIGRVVDMVSNGVRIAFNMGDCATRFAIAAIQRR